ncbi:carbon-nitrogen hydrolase [Auricularia subglabra TFB-10046 SS5]|nr:carbon-nitrogen hydrolase [Auricularia subglabra TFB-10046 SS5]
MASQRALRVAVVQFNPKLGAVQGNIARVQELIASSSIERGSIDLLVLPEMAFSGYVFRSPDAIRPHLEHRVTGPTTAFAQDLASKLSCAVIAGYPQTLEENEVREEHQVGANAAVVCAPDGGIAAVYRKTNLYDGDLPWCLPGTGFASLDLLDRRVALGICMDLNPDRSVTAWSYEDGPFELASFTLQQDAKVLVLLCAWLDSKFDSEADADTHNLRYWVARLDPLWNPSKGDRVVIISNRCGTEEDVLFAGSSLVLHYSASKNRVSLVQSLGRRDEAVLQCTVTI